MFLIAVLESGLPTGMRLPAIALGLPAINSLPATPPINMASVAKMTSSRTLLSSVSTILKSLRMPSVNRLINEYPEALYRIARNIA